MKAVPRFLRLLVSAIVTASAGAACAASDLAFSEMFALPIGPRGLEATAKLRALEGQPVRLAGYMVRREMTTPGSFVLAPLPLSLGDEDDSSADDLPPSAVFVRLAPRHEAAAVPYAPGLLHLTGTLRIGAAREPDGRVSTVRLVLDEDSSRVLLNAVPLEGPR